MTDSTSSAIPTSSESTFSPASVISTDLKAATQELLRTGVVYATSKPNVYRSLFASRSAVATVLAPLDLEARFDDTRGLCFVTVAPPPADESAEGNNDGDDWNHPLVRRQRLTLEQSLMLAVLRRLYTDPEQANGIGAVEPTVTIDELMAELQLFLGSIGSESAEEKRVRDLLDQLYKHGVVSAVKDDHQVSIRPLICHVANATTLTVLLEHYKNLAERPAAQGQTS